MSSRRFLLGSLEFWTARRSSQSILKEISPEYSLEGLMLKLKLQYVGHLMQRTDSLEKTLILGKIEGGRRRGRQRMRWSDDIIDSMDMSLSKLRRWWWTERPGMLQSMGSQRVGHDWTTEPNLEFCKHSIYHLQIRTVFIHSFSSFYFTFFDCYGFDFKYDILSKSGKSRHPYLLLDFRENTVSFSLTNMMMLAVDLYMVFLMFAYIPLIPTLLRVFLS